MKSNKEFRKYPKTPDPGSQFYIWGFLVTRNFIPGNENWHQIKFINEISN